MAGKRPYRRPAWDEEAGVTTIDLEGAAEDQNEDTTGPRSVQTAAPEAAGRTKKWATRTGCTSASIAWTSVWRAWRSVWRGT